MSKKISLKVKFENLTKAQAVALVNMFNEMERFGYVGHSAYIGFFADGDGSFHPKVKHNLHMNKDEIEKLRERTLVYEKDHRPNSKEKKFPWTDSITLFDFDGLGLD